MRISVLVPLFTLAVSACGSDEPPPPPPTQLDLRILDSTTEAPVSAWVRFEGQDAWTEATDGRLLVEAAAGTHRIWVRAAHHAPRPRPLEEDISVTLVATQTLEHTLLMDPIASPSEPRGTVRGSITLDGQPAANVLVVASGSLDRAAITDAAGQYILVDVAFENFGLSTRSGTHEDAVGAAIGEATVSQAPLLSLGAPATGSVQGAVTDAPNATVELIDPITGFSSAALRTETDGMGAFAFSSVPAGTYQVRVGVNEDGRVFDPNVERLDGLPEIDVGAAPVVLNLDSAPTVTGLTPANTSSVAPQPMWTWDAFPGADFYVVELRDSSDSVIWGGFDSSGSWRFQVTNGMTEATYPNEALTAGAHYRFRVFAAVRDPLIAANFVLVGASELRDGHFRVQR